MPSLKKDSQSESEKFKNSKIQLFSYGKGNAKNAKQFETFGFFTESLSGQKK